MQQGCYTGFFKGVQRVDFRTYKGVKTNTKCKMWGCPTCRPINVRKLRARIFNGNMNQFIKKGYRYQTKFLTLTCPGQVFRSQNSVRMATKLMSRSFHKLMKALAKSSGDFHYLRVVEAQRDGYPHYHVLLVGAGIANKNILSKIRNLWVSKYGMGNIDLKPVTSLEHAVRYITKYMLKSEGVFMKNGKKYTASKDALQPITKRTWMEKKFYMGVVRVDHEGQATVKQVQLDPLSPLFEWDIQGFIENWMRDDKTPF